MARPSREYVDLGGKSVFGGGGSLSREELKIGGAWQLALVCALYLVSPPSLGSGPPLQVGCHLGSYFDEPAIWFSGIEGEVDPENYADEGRLSLIAEMQTTAGKWRKFSVPGKYEKVGNRLELRDADFVRFDSDQISRSEFKQIFGALPELKCSAY